MIDDLQKTVATVAERIRDGSLSRRSLDTADGVEPVAWLNGEQELAQRWLARLIAKLGSKPDHADDVLWLERVNHLLFLASRTPNTEMMVKALTGPQVSFLQRLSKDDFGLSRHMSAGDRRVGYALKEMGLVMLDGAISSSTTEHGATFDGMTFVLTDAGNAYLSALASPPSPAEVTEWPPAPDGWLVRRPAYVRRDGRVSVEYCHGTEQPWQVRLSHGNGASHSLSEHDTPAAALAAALQLNKNG